MNPVEWYRNKRIVITGGLGFIGSTLAHRLVGYGARVRVVDAALAGSGANPLNIRGIESAIELWHADLRDHNVIETMLVDQDVLFNLAAQAGHLASMEDPETDLTINATCQLRIAEACHRLNPTLKIVHTATRQMYGRTHELPIDEDHAINPIDYNGVSKRAGELYLLVGHRAHGLRVTSLRLTNTYGPRMHCRDARQHFLGDWVRRLLTDQPILIFGNGSQIRDFNYVDDVVAALLSAAAEPSTDGRVYNLGSDEPISLTDLAQTLIAVNGRGRIEYTPFPPDRQRIDIGDYHGDFTRIHAALAWAPTTSLRTGLASTLAFVNQQRAGYL